MIEQNDDEVLVEAFGKLAVAVFTLQSENRSSLRAMPQPNAVLPLQTGDYWLLELAKLVTAGVPRSRLATALDNVAFVSVTYDRAIPHLIPFMMATAYGMPLDEARAITAAGLQMYYPCGSVGRLPWQVGDAPEAEWGDEQAADMVGIAAELRVADEALDNGVALAAMRRSIAESARLVFLGFDFAPQSLDLLIDGNLSHGPELVIGGDGLSAPNRAAALRLLKRKTGTEQDERVIVSEGKCLDLLKDYSLLLESEATRPAETTTAPAAPAAPNRPRFPAPRPRLASG